MSQQLEPMLRFGMKGTKTGGEVLPAQAGQTAPARHSLPCDTADLPAQCTHLSMGATACPYQSCQ